MRVSRFRDGSLDIKLNDVIIQDNTTEYMGGGIIVYPFENSTVDMEIRDSVLKNNQAPGSPEGRYGRGGAIHLHAHGGNTSINILIANSLIYENHAHSTGGGISIGASEVGDNNVTQVVVINSTITDNLSNMHDTGTDDDGGGIYVRAYNGNGARASLDLYNTILHGNTSLGSGQGQDLYVGEKSPGHATANAYNCDIGDFAGLQASYNPVNVINADPTFVDPSNGDYHLETGSPCIDSGDNTAPNISTFDIDGNPRIQDGDYDGDVIVDMGAYEYNTGIVGEIIILTPNGGETIPAGSNQSVMWVAPEDVETFKLKLSTNNGKKWQTIVDGILGMIYTWQVPIPKKNETRCVLEVIGFDATGVEMGKDVSDSPFTIEVLTLTSPTDEDILLSGDTHTIEWITHGTINPVSQVKLKYSKNGGRKWKKIATIEEDNPETYDWMIPYVPSTKDRCKLKVILKDENGKTVGKCETEGFFTIEP